MNRPEYHLAWSGFTLTLGQKTRIMGILNITPNSFSDGDRFFDRDQALAQAETLVEAGADILDIGGESTRPFSEAVDAEEEIRRVVPVIAYLAKKIPIPISIDTTKAIVAQQAIAAGASVINDISALHFDDRMAEVAAANDVLLILMHIKGTPRDMQVDPTYDDLMGEVTQFLTDAGQRAEQAGVAKKNIILDPGIGFGKTLAHNLSLIRHLHEFHRLDRPLLLGTSRKAFIRKLLVPKNQTELPPDHPLVETGTQASVAAGIMAGAHIVRVHDVAGTRATVKIMDAIRNAG